ncbi:HAD-like domain-containing protein [Pyronema omphalodes]|nr:HAD-like domain-containing protein [Pyronema omphalodes]
MQKPRKALLVTFDAWKTLFSPRAPIAQQYVEVAHQHGVIADEAVIKKSFGEAFAALSKTHPIYGHSTGMHPDTWWTQLIQQTFSPHPLPPTLAPALLSHFASSSAYVLHPNVPHLLHSLRALTGRRKYDKVILGVLSNSDYRVIPILQSLGVGVRDQDPAKRHTVYTGIQENGLIDTVTLSYDVGVEKPHPRMWLVAWNKARALERNGALWWDRVHVGDDWEKDYLGAKEMKWRAVMWDGERDWKSVLGEILGEEGAEGVKDLQDSSMDVVGERSRDEDSVWMPGRKAEVVKKDSKVEKQTEVRSQESFADNDESGRSWRMLDAAKDAPKDIDNKGGIESSITLDTSKEVEEIVSKKKDIMFAKQRRVRRRVSVIEETERTEAWKSWL